jgi:hypothetical protein
MTIGEYFWKSFKYMKEPICRTKQDREEKIVDEAFDAGRRVEREEIIELLKEK